MRRLWLTFSREENGHYVPLTDDQGREIKISVEAERRDEVLTNPDVLKFCQEHNCRIRRVMTWPS